MRFISCDNNENITLIERIYLPDSIKVIDREAFMDCANLVYINIPLGLETIISGAFCGCYNVQFDMLNSHYRVEGRMLINSMKNSLVSYHGNDENNVILPDSLRFIRSEVFHSCDALTKIVLLKNIEEIGELAFAYNNLFKIELPPTLRIIGPRAFIGGELRHLTLPPTVESIGYCAFNLNAELQTINIPPSVNYISPITFADCFKLSRIIVSQGDEDRVKKMMGEEMGKKVCVKNG